MSKSRSPSPTHNLSSTINLSETTNLRQPALEERSPHQQSGEYTEPLTVRLSPPPPELPEPSSRRRQFIRPAEDSTEEPMAKRIRRVSPELRSRADSHSSPSSEDSQDDLADNEMDVAKLNRPEPLPTTSAPPKKKRTRTLTTPHQSAVLHALLAQSRFPTTAMREEVGRSIGLSARKVQIWFQNQRQKSRRPRSQSDTPSNRPPQYGPFPNVSESTSHLHSYDEHGLNRVPYASASQPSRGGPPEISPRLLGPGMPGVRYAPQSEAYRHAGPASMSSMPLGHTMGARSQHRALSPPPYRSPRMYSHPGARPATSQSTSWREFDPSRTLPPLVSTRPSSSSYAASRNMHSSGSGRPYIPAAGPAFPPPRSISPEPMFAHQPPEPSPRHLIHLPPPFTLEPSPQWDESAYSAVPRPSSSVWSRPSSRSTRGRSTSPVHSRRDHMASMPQPSDSYYLTDHTPHLPSSSSPRSMPPASTLPSRSGRYDPVRASFVAFSTPTRSPVVSPPRINPDVGGGDTEPADDCHNPSQPPSRADDR